MATKQENKKNLLWKAEKSEQGNVGIKADNELKKHCVNEVVENERDV